MKIKKQDEYKIVKEFDGEIGKAIAKEVRFGMILLIVFVVGFLGWGFAAKIDKAAIATGEIVPGGSNRIVQHLEGGVIEQILVKEGDIVKEGDVLVKLSKKAASANFEIYDSALNTTVAEYSRLTSERDGLDKVKYPDEWVKNPEKFKSFMSSQNKIFEERVKGYKGKLDILDERTKQLTSQIGGIKSQINATTKQLEYTSREIVAVEKLLASGNTTMTRMLDLKSRKSQIEGQIGELRASVAKTEQEISENKLNKISIRNDSLNEVVEKIKEAEAKMNEFKQRGGTASDTLSRTEIRAPVTGVVKDIKYKTAGSSGVIPPNGEVLTIVPIADELVAEVKILPTDIDVVRKPNLKTRIRISAYSARHIPMLDGKLVNVSADSFKEPQTQKDFYKGRVTIDTKILKKYLADNKDVNQEALLYPGMPVEVYIVTGERSPISYLFEPIMNDARRSFREE